MHARLTEVPARERTESAWRVARKRGALCIGNFKSQLGNNLRIDSYYYEARVCACSLEKGACVCVCVCAKEERFPLSDPWFSRFYGSFCAFVLRLDLRATWLAREEFYFSIHDICGEVYATLPDLKFKKADLYTRKKKTNLHCLKFFVKDEFLKI